jgi:histidinol phosphatase-like PHP family hydrolase
MDLHLHTPASEDYLQPEIGYLDILKQAASKGLDMIAFTDHNTVAGYRRMMEEIDQLKLLQQLNRLLPEEEMRLADYHKLLNRVLILPGFEFTATFGFHILAIFPEDKPVYRAPAVGVEYSIRKAGPGIDHGGSKCRCPDSL